MLTSYDWDIQQSVLKSHLPERYSRLTETDYEDATQLVNAVSNYWFNYVKPQIDAAAQRNQLKHAQNATTIAGIDGQTNGDNGGGGKGGYGKKQQVRTYPHGGKGKQQQQQQPRHQQAKNTRDRNGHTKQCFLCKSEEHLADLCPRADQATAHVAALMESEKTAANDEEDDCDEDEDVDQNTALKMKKNSLGAIKRASKKDKVDFADFVCGVTPSVSPSMTAYSLMLPCSSASSASA